MDIKPPPNVSVVIINWNHGQFLDKCLGALKNQSYPACSIIIIDNGSSDDSVIRLRQEEEVRLFVLPNNIGFSRAFNYAVRLTDDPFVLSLNPDVTINPDFISELVKAVNHSERIGIAAPKLVRADQPSQLDSTGLFINRRRRPYDRGQGEVDRGQYDNQIDVFGACGAAVLYRRTMLDDVAINGEYFDEHFFAYYEDADLSWRAQLKDWHAIYVPTAIAKHVRGWGDTLRKQRSKNSMGPRLALRNRFLMVVKNDTRSGFFRDFPAILSAEIPRLFFVAFTSPKVLLGIGDLIKLIPFALLKRKYIHKNLKVNPDTIREKYFIRG